MKLYIAGMFHNGSANRATPWYAEMMNDFERAIVESVRYKLESYHYVGNPRQIEVMTRQGARVFMDSGAFSAMTLGKAIDLESYCRYLRDNPHLVEVASVLDGIGDPLKTYQNQVAMEREGLNILPCFHYGEDERYLEYYIERYEYITIGGLVPNTTDQNRAWLDHIWTKYLCDGNGRPKRKVHGFGMTSIPLMQRYPWFSVDSSSWVQIGFRGAIILPPFGSIHVSSNSPARKDEGAHFDTFAPIEKEAIENIITARGFNRERLSTVYISRWVFNLDTFARLNTELEQKDLRFINEQLSIF